MVVFPLSARAFSKKRTFPKLSTCLLLSLLFLNSDESTCSRNDWPRCDLENAPFFELFDCAACSALHSDSACLQLARLGLIVWEERERTNALRIRKYIGITVRFCSRHNHGGPVKYRGKENMCKILTAQQQLRAFCVASSHVCSARSCH